MAAQIIAMFATSFDSNLGWFEDIMDNTGVWPLFIAMFCLYHAFRFFLKPILGGAGSDKARARKDDEE